MSDPRNVAHGKKVAQEKQHAQAKPAGGGKRKSRNAKQSVAPDANAPTTETAKAEQTPGELEKSLTVLSKLKDMEFHSRANIEALAGLILTIEEELKQKEFSDSIGELYAAQDGFHTQIAALIASYEAKCEGLKMPA